MFWGWVDNFTRFLLEGWSTYEAICLKQRLYRERLARMQRD